jgi:hypothetical protein
MSGLNWTSYVSNTTLDAGPNTLTQLYNNAITFFSSPPAQLASGALATLQIESGYLNDNPPFSTFSTNPAITERIAIKFSGYFVPDQTGVWTIYLGPGRSTPCDDVGILFLGKPGDAITPGATFTSESNVPDNTLPFIRNRYDGLANSKTVSLKAGYPYPILIYYNQGGGGYYFGLGFSFESGGLITDFSTLTSTVPVPIPPPITCFNEGSKILTDRGYIAVEDLRKGDRVKTLTQGYKAIDMIGKKGFYNPAEKVRIKDQLYKCSMAKYPELTEDLIITGCHCILIDDFESNEQRDKTVEINNGDIYITENQYRLPACVDDRAVVYETDGIFTVYHFALENDDYYTNYGVYANGLLVESCSKRYLKELSNMELIK